MANRLTTMIAVWRGVLGGMTGRPWAAVSRNTAFDDWRIEGPDGSAVRPSKGDSDGIATLRNIATRLLDVVAAAHAARRFGTITHALEEALDRLADDPDGTAKWWVGGEHFTSNVVSPVVEPWETARAREWLRDHGRLDHRERVDTLSALLRDCWAAGYSDGWDAGAISAHHDASAECPCERCADGDDR